MCSTPFAFTQIKNNLCTNRTAMYISFGQNRDTTNRIELTGPTNLVYCIWANVLRGDGFVLTIYHKTEIVVCHVRHLLGAC